MKLFIAEKPNMGRSIAKNLPGPHTSKDGYIETPTALVTWCIGHLLETAPPDAYDKKYEAFPGKFDDLPILPDQWKLQVTGDKHKQVNVIKGLLKKCTEVVNAGDPGREGQLIIDELLDFLGNTKPVKRILLNALDDLSVQKELGNLHDNKQFYPLYQAGLGRQRADWIIGMNMSRAYTILGGMSGYRGVLSVGRVQSPTLAIVVRRDREIENFVPKDYWTITGVFENANAPKIPFKATWIPPGTKITAIEDEEEDEDETAAPATASQTAKPAWLDEANRIVDVKIANAIVAKVKGKTGAIADAQRKRVQEQQPLPYDLSGVQKLANARWSTSIQDALNACQSLYDKGYTTYPRTDCEYLPENQHKDAQDVLNAIKSAHPHMASLVDGADATIKSRAWNDKKMGEHHAIIPTRQPADMTKLTELEKKVYLVICERFLAQFYPPAEVDKAKLIVEVEKELFQANGRQIVAQGWRVVYGGADVDKEDNDKAKAEEKDQDDNPDAVLPNLNKGDPCLCKDAKANAKQTKPPARFTQGTLLEAMKKVHTLVTDPAVKKKLKDLDGIGRSATRAAIIETLLKRRFLEPKGKQIISTPVGRALVDALPSKLIDPALTAMWEQILDAVALGKTQLSAFMQKQTEFVVKLVDTSKTIQKIDNLPQGFPEPSKKPGSKSGSSKSKGSGKASSSASKTTGKAQNIPADAKPCPKCKKGHLVKRVAKGGPNAGKEFYGCTNYPDCKHAENPK